MTITSTVPSITPCPVNWCPTDGSHQWVADRPEIGIERWHTLSVQDFTSIDGDVTSEVAVECFETSDGVQQTTVELFSGRAQLLNRAEANELMDSIRRAADLAFDPQPDADLDEFEAATAELVQRAANPADVNRLVAAAIRFRNAYLGA
ncbi:hypothetical protein [Nakamurella multipartita]|uniref:Uncharacterized protein n=1 Tax=Nakamurella multipartita (strain ATCC 700099 / DSM 44233 / CIP 104796 / JCM 9543 / NBRC 105858 / Y-104) TaxID=479431 RepID=C8XEQ0_NAKMY|nr:hypothetical protein [Nakamurella multipartita]ACV79801.1 hypothetical protein Namu_3476 [Nakamurella multipartita DSM 44233]